MLAAVYFNGGNSNLFRVWVDVTLVDLKDQLDQINQRLNHRDAKKVDVFGIDIHRSTQPGNCSLAK